MDYSPLPPSPSPPAKKRAVPDPLVETTVQTAKAVTVKFADLMVSAFGFVSALAWNDAVGSLFKPGGKLQFLNGGVWMYAVAVTLLALLIAYWRARLVPLSSPSSPSSQQKN